MKPSVYPLLTLLNTTVGSRRSVLYKNGTSVLLFQDDIEPNPIRYLSLFKQLKTSKSLILQESKVYDDYKSYYCYDDNYPNICILYVADLQSNLTDDEIKIQMLNNYENDLKSLEIIFDSDKQKYKDYETVMYLFVNNDLGMGKGKIAGQVGHAVGKLIERLVKNPSIEYLDWSQTLCKKIVLKATANQLIQLSQSVNGIAIHDAGRTQIPSGSLTVVGFPPCYLCEVPSNFSQYKLL